jgi:Uma2 family endonuclease
VLLDEPEIHLGPKPDIVVPDLAGWRRERMPDELGPADGPPYYDVAPDWVCEILSPSSEAIDRGKKMRIYRREAVQHAWLIDPIERILEVYRREGAHWMLLDTFEEDAVVRAEPFEAIEIRVGELFGDEDDEDDE